MIKTGMAACVLMWSVVATAEPTAETLSDSQARATMLKLDAALFDAYNRCDLKAFESYLDPHVEFYHDKGGVTHTSAEVTEGVRKNICHKVRRELIAESFEASPIPGFGAVEAGSHRFCQVDTGKCEGLAQFLMLWEHKDGHWKITRVVSYAHQSVPAS